MIQLGEAGWFLPVGGMVLGGLRPETGEFSYRVLPVEFFQGERFQDRHYVQEACNLVAEILSGLNVPKHTEPLQICAGNIMPYIRFWAYQQGYQYSSIPEAKELQILLDTALFQHLSEDIDLKNVDFQTLHGKRALANWLCWQWLRGGNINACRACLPANAWRKRVGVRIRCGLGILMPKQNACSRKNRRLGENKIGWADRLGVKGMEAYIVKLSRILLVQLEHQIL